MAARGARAAAGDASDRIPRSAPLADAAHLVTAFRQGLKEEGFVEGQNVAIEFRWAESQADRLPALAAELIRRPVAAIVAQYPFGARRQGRNRDGADRLRGRRRSGRIGLVASLNRPGGNVTGVVLFGGLWGRSDWSCCASWCPSATIAMLVNPNDRDSAEAERRDAQAAAQTIGQQLIIVDASTDREMEAAFATFVQRGAVRCSSVRPVHELHRERVVALAARHALPAIYHLPRARRGRRPDELRIQQPDAYRQAGIYTGRILKGEKPADLPVMRSTKFEFVINLKTAKTLGVEIPSTLLALADEVIE